MKTTITITIISVLVCVLLAFPAPVQATIPVPLMIEADLYMTGANSAAGSFTASSLFTDAGAASEEFFTADGTIHGVKTLVSTPGSITIKFQAQMTWTSATTGFAKGRFVIISGTGAYKNLHGVGETYAKIDLAAYHILASYTGTGHFN